MQRRRIGVIGLAWVMAGCADAGSDPQAATDGDGSGGADTSAGTEDGGEASAGESTGGDADARPNWHEDIAPLVATHCRSCHSDGKLAFSMDDYEDAKVWAGSMAAQTQLRLMPPWHAVETDGCTPPAPFEHDARLEQAEIDAFAAWADLGAPQGDPAKAAPLPEPPSIDLADPNVIVPMGAEITVEGDGATLDYFHCLSFDPGHDQTVYVDGLQVVPGNATILHHVLIFVDEQADSASWPDGVLHDCGGGGGIDQPRLVGGWVPGGMPIEPPEDVGIVLPAGARIVFNVHYHASPMGPESDDTTAIALRWTTTPPQWVSQLTLLGAPGLGDSVTGDFVIPAGATGHEEALRWTVPASAGNEVRLWSIGHHMHKVGVDARTTLTRAGGDTECLLQTPRWDFGWQRLYEYDRAIEDTVALAPGDSIEVRCAYDNALSNPQVVAALAEVGQSEPHDVVLGEGSLDEMCIAGVGLAARP